MNNVCEGTKRNSPCSSLLVEGNSKLEKDLLQAAAQEHHLQIFYPTRTQWVEKWRKVTTLFTRRNSLYPKYVKNVQILTSSFSGFSFFSFFSFFLESFSISAAVLSPSNSYILASMSCCQGRRQKNQRNIRRKYLYSLANQSFWF